MRVVPEPVMDTILVLNGPNLNMLGTREPQLYGAETLGDVESACRARAKALGVALDFLQSNHEGELVDAIQKARREARAIVINPAGYGHTSVALFDALSMFDGPVIEVHISQIFRREPFRHHTYSSARADGVIAGFGTQGYLFAIERAVALLKS